MEALLELLGHGLRSIDKEPKAAVSMGGHRALLVLDLEMSGANPAQHEVLEVGVVRATIAGGLPEELNWGTRVKPKHIGTAVPGALKVVGYTPKAWKDAADLEVAFAHLVTIGEGAVVTGWGIGNDLAFLHETFRRLERPWPFAPIALDVQPIARRLLKGTGDVDRFNLGHVADRLGIGRMGEHSALADAFATYDVLLKLIERHSRAKAAKVPSSPL
jgi:DNA polymerase III epsilon subunit-like protein